MAFSSLVIPRTILSHASPRLFLRGNRLRSFAFSSASALGNSFSVNRHPTVSGLQRDVGKFSVPQRFPRPETIVWQRDLANKVHLVGNIGKPVELKHTSSGNALAWTTLAVKLDYKSPEATWFDLKFWGEMAEIAAEHVKRGDYVYVSGYMNHDATQDDKNSQTLIKVVVSFLNFIERDSSFSPQKVANMNISSSSSPQEGINMKHAIPDSPQDAYMKQATSGNKVMETEKLWQAFFLNPTEWWDNRNDKRNPKAPDFKHKSTGEGLWVESYKNPQWVRSQLDKLDESMSLSYRQTNPKKTLSSFGDSDFNLF